MHSTKKLNMGIPPSNIPLSDINIPPSSIPYANMPSLDTPSFKIPSVSIPFENIRYHLNLHHCKNSFWEHTFCKHTLFKHTSCEHTLCKYAFCKHTKQFFTDSVVLLSCPSQTELSFVNSEYWNQLFYATIASLYIQCWKQTNFDQGNGGGALVLIQGSVTYYQRQTLDVFQNILGIVCLIFLLEPPATRPTHILFKLYRLIHELCCVNQHSSQKLAVNERLAFFSLSIILQLILLLI